LLYLLSGFLKPSELFMKSVMLLAAVLLKSCESVTPGYLDMLPVIYPGLNKLDLESPYLPGLILMGGVYAKFDSEGIIIFHT
jgi:hypothetical protein